MFGRRCHVKNLIAAIIVNIILGLNAIVIIAIVATADLQATEGRAVFTAIFQCMWLLISVPWLAWSIGRFRQNRRQAEK